MRRRSRDYETLAPIHFRESKDAPSSDIKAMRDTLLRECWRVVILSMIFALVMAGLSMIYRALFAALGGSWPSALGMISVTLIAALGLKWLCDNRNELVEF